MSAQGPARASGGGWFTFAAAMFAIAAIAHILWGASAVADKSYLNGGDLLFGSLSLWGWISIIWGALCAGIAGLLAVRSGIGLGLALFVLVASSGFWILTLPLQPHWSLIVIAINVALIYGLSAHDELAR